MPGYEPLNFANADSFWANAMIGYSQNTQAAQNVAPSAYLQTFQNQQNIDYSPFLEGAKNMGSMYQGLADLSGQQMQGFGQQAESAYGMEGLLYGASGQLIHNAFSGPNIDQYQGQVQQGMSQRGLTDQAMTDQATANFKMDWQNQSLGWQSLALNTAARASDAWTKQAGIYSASLQNQMSAGMNQASMTGMAAQVPLEAQQYVAGQPAANANQYIQNLSMVNQMQSGQATHAQNYMTINYLEDGGVSSTNASTAAMARLIAILGDQAGMGSGDIGDSIGAAVGDARGDSTAGIGVSAGARMGLGFAARMAGFVGLISPPVATAISLSLLGYSLYSAIAGWLGWNSFDPSVSESEAASSFGGFTGAYSGTKSGGPVGENDGDEGEGDGEGD
jgi:hypothetical protein